MFPKVFLWWWAALSSRAADLGNGALPCASITGPQAGFAKLRPPSHPLQRNSRSACHQDINMAFSGLLAEIRVSVYGMVASSHDKLCPSLQTPADLQY
ncbi:hypothetical protein P4O66_008943 [Electrophorus voltai]|uniref:Secreted protein n=1 Tax=Electrophorus voltai TaxID=2609070 RepID=A0AAD9DVS3_9TELE|nr:hypothetical protein P4O66_008943 [Electrophorus voltai]